MLERDDKTKFKYGMQIQEYEKLCLELQQIEGQKYVQAGFFADPVEENDGKDDPLKPKVNFEQFQAIKNKVMAEF